jgi:hypothetical protein
MRSLRHDLSTYRLLLLIWRGTKVLRTLCQCSALRGSARSSVPSDCRRSVTCQPCKRPVVQQAPLVVREPKPDRLRLDGAHDSMQTERHARRPIPGRVAFDQVLPHPIPRPEPLALRRLAPVCPRTPPAVPWRVEVLGQKFQSVFNARPTGGERRRLRRRTSWWDGP